jgi:hypothetical protein
LITSSNVGLGGNMPAMPTSIRSIVVENCAFTGLPPNLSGLTLLVRLYVHQNKLSGVPPVVSPLVSLCILQLNNAETNCFDCPVTGSFGPCTCVPNSNATACASLATTTTVAALPVTSQSAAIVTTASTTVRATTETNAIASTAPATSTTAATTSTTTFAANPGSTAALSTTATAPPSGEPEPWILGVIVGGAVFVLILVGLAVFFLLKHRRQAKAPSDAKEPKQPHADYGALPSKLTSNYAANAGEFKAGISQDSNYGLVRDTDHYAKSAVEFKAGVSQESSYGVIRDDELGK